MGRLQTEIILQAGSQLGVTELTGHNDGVAVESYLQSVQLDKGISLVYGICLLVYQTSSK